MKRWKLWLILIISFSTILAGCSRNQPQKNSNNNPEIITRENNLKITFIDVGQGDSILIENPSGKALLIDGGPPEGVKVILSTLKTKEIKDLTILATHNHADHISGLDEVIKENNINKVYLPQMPAKGTVTLERFLNSVQAKGLKLSKAVAGVNIDLGENVKAELLAPIKDKYEDENDYSAVLKLTYGETSFLFMGDAEGISERDLLDSKKDLKASLLKIGHHGSNSSSTEKFLKAVAPKFAVISVGKDNDYNHPSEKVIKRLNDLKIQTYRTDLSGTITVISDGKNIELKTSKGVVGK